MRICGLTTVLSVLRTRAGALASWGADLPPVGGRAGPDGRARYTERDGQRRSAGRQQLAAENITEPLGGPLSRTVGERSVQHRAQLERDGRGWAGRSRDGCAGGAGC